MSRGDGRTSVRGASIRAPAGAHGDPDRRCDTTRARQHHTGTPERLDKTVSKKGHQERQDDRTTGQEDTTATQQAGLVLKMVRVIVLSAVLILLCQQMLVMAHYLGKPSQPNSLSQLKTLLQQLEDTLAQAEAGQDYEEAIPEAEQQQQPNQVAQGWEEPQESPRPQPEEAALPEETQNNAQIIRSQRNRLQDLLLGTRSKSFSACFGGRLDRIGTSSGLGCNTSRG